MVLLMSRMVSQALIGEAAKAAVLYPNRVTSSVNMSTDMNNNHLIPSQYVYERSLVEGPVQRCVVNYKRAMVALWRRAFDTLSLRRLLFVRINVLQGSFLT